jgi:hypothetical protein
MAASVTIHVAWFFENLKIIYLKFQKILKKLDLSNDKFYKSAKFQLETPYILRSAQITKVEK